MHHKIPGDAHHFDFDVIWLMSSIYSLRQLMRVCAHTDAVPIIVTTMAYSTQTVRALSSIWP